MDELGASEENGIQLINDDCEFPEAKPLHSLPYELSSSYKELYGQIESAQFSWRLNLEDESTKEAILSEQATQQIIEQEEWTQEYLLDQIRGELIIPEIGKIDENGKKYGYIYSLESITEDPSLFIPVDINSRVVALLKITDGKLGEEIHLFDEESAELFEMKITLAEYFNLSFQCKSFSHWQLALIMGDESIHHQLLKTYLPLIFPIPTLDLSAWNI